MRRYSPILLGELAEAKFNHVGTAKGLILARLWNSRPFDFYAGLGRHIHRIQIKASASAANGGYHVICSHLRGRPYTAKDIDFIAVWIEPTDTWYIIPIRALRGCKSLHVYPLTPDSTGQYERYRERWDLLLR